MRRIRQISIKNLFGIFNHDIRLNLDERVTIIHSPNGFGKTAIFKLLNEVFTQGISVLKTTPFDEFHIYFEDHAHLWITQTVEEVSIPLMRDGSGSERKLARSHIAFYFSEAAGKSILEWPLHEREELAANIQLERQATEQLLLEAGQAEDKRAIDVYREKLMVLEYESHRRALDLAKGEKVPSWYQEIRKSIPIRFIETQRLLNTTVEARNQSSSTGKHPTWLPAVTLYSQELSQTLTAKLADSTTLTQSLDRTFPSRLVDLATRQSNIAEDELREKLAELEVKRKSLMAVGLVDPNANDAVLAADRIDPGTKSVLSLYVEDTRQKLAVFDDIAPKVELLTRIINKRFLYKEMSVSRKDGFVFRSTVNGKSLALGKLSSGEQHELVLFYELLFKASPGSLIMIDEPEISLHVVWQEQFLQDMQDITRLVDVDILIATHSPDIIDGHRNLVVELEGPKDGGL